MTDTHAAFVPPPGLGSLQSAGVCLLGGGFTCGRRVSEGAALCVDWLVPGARPGEIASLSTLSTNPVTPPNPLAPPPPHPSQHTFDLLGPAEHKDSAPPPPPPPPPRDDACVWRLIGGCVSALCPSPWRPSFFCPARDAASCVRRRI